MARRRSSAFWALAKEGGDQSAAATKQDGGLETHSFPNSLAATRRGFTFYVADPVSFIETRSLPALTRSYPRHFTFYVAHPIRSIHYFEQMRQSGNRRVHRVARQTRARNFVHLLGFWQSFSKRGSLRNGSQSGLNFRSATVIPAGTSRRRGNADMAESISPKRAWICASTTSFCG